MRETFEQILERKRREFGRRFDPSGLAPWLRPYYRSGQRLAVRYWHKGKPIPEVWTGTVGMTTGWRPVFILMLRMLRRDSSGSPHVLDANTELVAVSDGRAFRRPDGTALRLRRSPDTSIGAWMEAPSTPDALDAEVARQRLAEIRENPKALVSGEGLKDRLERWQKIAEDTGGRVYRGRGPSAEGGEPVRHRPWRRREARGDEVRVV